MTAEHPEQPGRVPVGELRALADAFEAYGESNERKSKIGGEFYEGAAVGRYRCSEELEAVIERYDQ